MFVNSKSALFMAKWSEEESRVKVSKSLANHESVNKDNPAITRVNDLQLL